jgi:glycine cleavage system aminomethyltransferase T
MAERKEQTTRIILENGDAINITVRDGMIIDDLIVQGAKAEAYRLMTGKDVFPDHGRDIKDYLIKTGVILD